jgi:DhnA family fructose-bisphosphate aldolase class Ia
MDERYAPQPIAGWYWLAAIGALVFMLVGCAVYGLHAYTDPATLPLDQRAMFEAEPRWVTTMLGVASILGTAGAIMLLLRRRPAVPLLLGSLIVTLIWFAGQFATPQLRDLFSTMEIAVLLAALAISWTIYWFARHSRQRGWLR